MLIRAKKAWGHGGVQRGAERVAERHGDGQGGAFLHLVDLGNHILSE